MELKFDVLEEYREYLDECESISKNTALRYFSAVKNLLQKYQFDSLSEIDTDSIESSLSKLKSKNSVSAAKNGLLRLHEFDSYFSLPDAVFFKELSSHKRNILVKKGRVIDTEKITHKINLISNKRLKMAYRLILVSGLRISEVADLKPGDIEFLDKHQLRVHVQNGKGGKQRDVVTTVDKYLYKGLSEHVRAIEVGGTVFYGESYMRGKAYALGFEPHDLRRAYAQLTKKLYKEQGQSAYAATTAVQNNLGHTCRKTTELYLTGRKIVRKKKKHKGKKENLKEDFELE